MWEREPGCGSHLLTDVLIKTFLLLSSAPAVLYQDMLAFLSPPPPFFSMGKTLATLPDIQW